MPKSSRSDWLVEKVTELGVSHIFPLVSGLSVLIPKGDQRISRWKRLIDQASKQSLSPHVTTLHPSINFQTMMKLISENKYERVFWGGMPNDPVYPSKFLSRSDFPDVLRSCMLIVGPEGDFSALDKDLLSKVGTPVCLSWNRLRVESASMLFVGLVAALSKAQEQGKLM
eukprot:TRINITY_DN15130_c0_g1_i1.p1 TRINITY_DN15130_c0_g1~~TRINITY_DN15130_c0_g1_i1.p1  ORF type:complete len:170 (-),score=20.14 TRINITY_DN15130_c0_g1_i1:174-683(-)